MEYYLRKQLSIVLILYVGQITAGFGLGWSSPLLPKLQDAEETPLPSVVTAGQASWIGSVVYVGIIIGPYLSGYLSNAQGRKPSFILGGILTIFAFLLLALARNVAMLFIGRIFLGLGNGVLYVTNLVYIGEFTSTNIRGILLTGTGIFTTVGTLVVYATGPYLPYAATNFVGLSITVLFIVGTLLFVPESPMFYIVKDRMDEAKEALTDLGREEDINKLFSAKLDKELTKEQSNWRQLYRDRSTRKAFMITLPLSIFQQLSGFIVVIFFATSIFELAGTSIRSDIATIAIGVAQVISSSTAPFFVERSGRRILLLGSTAMSSLSLMALGAFFLLDDLDHDSVQNLQWLPLTSLVVFFMSFYVGFNIIPNTLIGELYHSSVRSIGSTVTITASWVVGFAVSTSFSYMIDGIGAFGTFWMFSGFSALAFVFSAIFVPETKGMSLVEIEDMLAKK